MLGSKLIFFGRDPSTNNTGAVKLYVIDTTPGDVVRQATTAPSISGSPVVGQKLTGDKGAWTLENRFTYQWLRNGTPVPNAYGTTYNVSTADVGAQVTFRVTAVGDRRAQHRQRRQRPGHRGRRPRRPRTPGPATRQAGQGPDVTLALGP